MGLNEKMTALADTVRDLADRTDPLTLDDMISELQALSSVYVFNTAKGEILYLTDSADRKIRNLNLYGKTTQNGTPTPDTPVELVSAGDGGSIKVKIGGKNLLENKATTQTISGVTFTANADGSVTVNGTATNNIWYAINTKDVLPVGSYIMTGCTENSIGYYLVDYVHTTAGDYVRAFVNSGLPVTVDVTDPTWQHGYQIYIPSGAVVSDVTWYPMLRRASVADDTYEPYKTAQTMIAQSPNGLPGIPVSSGGNYTDADGQQWVCDEEDLARGVYIKRLYKYAFTGQEELTLYDDGLLVGRTFGSIGIPNCKVHTSGTPDYLATALCNVAQVKTQDHTKKSETLAFAISGWTENNAHFYFSTANYGGVDGIKASMAEAYANGEPWTILYELDEPIETALDYSTIAAYAALRTNYPNTTIFNDAGAGMLVKYVTDTKAYIDNQVAALSNAIVNNA